MSTQLANFEAIVLPAIEYQAEIQIKQLQYTLANFAIVRFKKGVELRFIKSEE
jgi:hypothetical protein